MSSRELTDDEVDRIFRALADATRRDIVRRTLAGEVTVSQLASSYDMSFAAVQKHVTVLEQAGLVSKRALGRERRVRGRPETLQHAQGLLDRYERIWRDRIARLDTLLSDEPARLSESPERPDSLDRSDSRDRLPDSPERPDPT